jgi:hypothetical protein
MRWMVAVVVLAGCVEGVEAPLPVSCGADGLQGLVGQPAAVLQTIRFGQVVRVIRPGMAVTMDYVPERLNIDIDAAEVISGVRCG